VKLIRKKVPPQRNLIFPQNFFLIPKALKSESKTSKSYCDTMHMGVSEICQKMSRIVLMIPCDIVCRMSKNPSYRRKHLSNFVLLDIAVTEGLAATRSWRGSNPVPRKTELFASPKTFWKATKCKFSRKTRTTLFCQQTLLFSTQTITMKTFIWTWTVSSSRWCFVGTKC